MSTLCDHIQQQQDAATSLETVLSALEALRLEGVSPKTQTELIVMARLMAHKLAVQLDVVSLPRGIDA